MTQTNFRRNREKTQTNKPSKPTHFQKNTIFLFHLLSTLVLWLFTFWSSMLLTCASQDKTVFSLLISSLCFILPVTDLPFKLWFTQNKQQGNLSGRDIHKPLHCWPFTPTNAHSHLLTHLSFPSFCEEKILQRSRKEQVGQGRQKPSLASCLLEGICRFLVQGKKANIR